MSYTVRLNAAAHLVNHTQKCDHLTPVIQQLQWLPVWQQCIQARRPNSQGS